MARLRSFDGLRTARADFERRSSAGIIYRHGGADAGVTNGIFAQYWTNSFLHATRPVAAQSTGEHLIDWRTPGPTHGEGSEDCHQPRRLRMDRLTEAKKFRGRVEGEVEFVATRPRLTLELVESNARREAGGADDSAGAGLGKATNGRATPPVNYEVQGRCGNGTLDARGDKRSGLCAKCGPDHAVDYAWKRDRRELELLPMSV